MAIEANTLDTRFKLTDTMIEALSAYVAKGNYANKACYLCGIHESTLYRWINNAEQDIEAGKESIYTRLYKSLKRARAEAQREMIEVARNAAIEKKDGYLAITFLERTDPENWARRDRQTIDINENKTITITNIEVVKDYGNRGEIIEGEVKELPPG